MLTWINLEKWQVIIKDAWNHIQIKRCESDFTARLDRTDMEYDEEQSEVNRQCHQDSIKISRIYRDECNQNCYMQKRYCL